MLPQAPEVSLPIAISIASTGTTVLVAAVAGQTVYLDELDLVFDVAVAGASLQLQDTASTVLDYLSLVTVGPHVHRFNGTPLAFSKGVQLFNPTGGAVFVRGKLTYSQY